MKGGVFGVSAITLIFLASLVVGQIPNPGHEWPHLECTTVFCVDPINGRVGIGNTAPNSKLHVKDPTGSVIAVDSGTGGLQEFSAVDFWNNGAAMWGLGKDNGLGDFYIDRNGVGRAFTILASSRNVGIGTGSPPNKLTIHDGEIALTRPGGPGPDRGIVWYPGQGDGDEYIRRQGAADGILFGTQGTDRMIIDALGNIGIGTASPTQQLEVAGGIRLSSPPAQPFCDSSVRGTIWHLRGAAGLRDRVEFCLKNADETYTWQEIGAVVPPIDADGDGFPAFAAGGTDCVDTDAAINPGSGVTCNYGVTCTLPPPDDASCGVISCSGRFIQSGIESPTTTETCFNKADITSNRCEDYNDCKDANSVDCDIQPNGAAQYACGDCKFISASACTGGTLGSCTNHASGTSCGAGSECDGSGNCIFIPTLFPIHEDISSGHDEALGVAVDGSGFYVVGADQTPGERQWHMEKRSLSTGALMWTQLSFPLPFSNSAKDVAVDSTGIYIVGTSQIISGVDDQWRMEKRSLGTGALIWSQVSNPTGLLDWANGVAVDGSGVYIAGHQRSGGDEWRIEKRSLSSGAVLWTLTNNPSAGPDYANDIAVDSTGIYIVGSDGIPGDGQWRIEKRSLSTGSLIWAQVSNPGSGTDVARAVAVDSTGVYTVGPDFSPGNYQWRIEKRSLTTGALIWTQVSNPSSGHDYANDIAIDITGIYVAGNDNSLGGINYQWRIEKRSLSTGAVLWTTTRNPSGSLDEGEGVATDGVSVYMVGTDRIPVNMAWQINKRSAATGAQS